MTGPAELRLESLRAPYERQRAAGAQPAEQRRDREDCGESRERQGDTEYAAEERQRDAPQDPPRHDATHREIVYRPAPFGNRQREREHGATDRSPGAEEEQDGENEAPIRSMTPRVPLTLIEDLFHDENNGGEQAPYRRPNERRTEHSASSAQQKSHYKLRSM